MQGGPVIPHIRYLGDGGFLAAGERLPQSPRSFLRRSRGKSFVFWALSPSFCSFVDWLSRLFRVRFRIQLF